MYPRILERERQYTTGLFGKWHIAGRPPFQNFTVFYRQGKYLEPRILRQTQWPEDVQDDEKVWKDTNYVPKNTWAADVVKDEAITFLSKAQSPWLLHAHFKETHENWMFPPRHAKIFNDLSTMPVPPTLLLNTSTSHRLHEGWPLASLGDRMARNPYGANETLDLSHVTKRIHAIYEKYARDYLRAAASLDDAVGAILQAVESQRDNTFVIYTSDNGLFVGEHGYFDKRFGYDPSQRVPCYVRYPREIRSGTVFTNFVTNIDWAPTILDVAGLPVEVMSSRGSRRGKRLAPKLRGRSLRQRWLGGSSNDDQREFVYYRYYGAAQYLRPRPQRPSHLGVRTRGMKLLFFDGLLCTSPEPFELYDLLQDPEETRNIYLEADPKLKRDLHSVLIKAMRDAGDTVRGDVKGDHLPRNSRCATLTPECLLLIRQVYTVTQNATTLSEVPQALTKCRSDLQNAPPLQP